MPSKTPKKRKAKQQNAKRSLQAVVGRDDMRAAVANYMRSEGCSCCRDSEAHERHTAALGRLLKVPKYKDGSGYNFARFEAPNDQA